MLQLCQSSLRSPLIFLPFCISISILESACQFLKTKGKFWDLVWDCIKSIDLLRGGGRIAMFIVSCPSVYEHSIPLDSIKKFFSQ